LLLLQEVLEVEELGVAQVITQDSQVLQGKVTQVVMARIVQAQAQTWAVAVAVLEVQDLVPAVARRVMADQEYLVYQAVLLLVAVAVVL
jgi:hypothetical protein